MDGTLKAEILRLVQSGLAVAFETHHEHSSVCASAVRGMRSNIRKELAALIPPGARPGLYTRMVDGIGHSRRAIDELLSSVFALVSRRFLDRSVGLWMKEGRDADAASESLRALVYAFHRAEVFSAFAARTLGLSFLDQLRLKSKLKVSEMVMLAFCEAFLWPNFDTCFMPCFRLVLCSMREASLAAAVAVDNGSGACVSQAIEEPAVLATSCLAIVMLREVLVSQTRSSSRGGGGTDSAGLDEGDVVAKLRALQSHKPCVGEGGKEEEAKEVKQEAPPAAAVAATMVRVLDPDCLFVAAELGHSEGCGSNMDPTREAVMLRLASVLRVMHCDRTRFIEALSERLIAAAASHPEGNKATAAAAAAAAVAPFAAAAAPPQMAAAIHHVIAAENELLWPMASLERFVALSLSSTLEQFFGKTLAALGAASNASVAWARTIASQAGVREGEAARASLASVLAAVDRSSAELADIDGYESRRVSQHIDTFACALGQHVVAAVAQVKGLLLQQRIWAYLLGASSSSSSSSQHGEGAQGRSLCGHITALSERLGSIPKGSSSAEAREMGEARVVAATLSMLPADILRSGVVPRIAASSVAASVTRIRNEFEATLEVAQQQLLLQLPSAAAPTKSVVRQMVLHLNGASECFFTSLRVLRLRWFTLLEAVFPRVTESSDSVGGSPPSHSLEELWHDGGSGGGGATHALPHEIVKLGFEEALNKPLVCFRGGPREVELQVVELVALLCDGLIGTLAVPPAPSDEEAVGGGVDQPKHAKGVAGDEDADDGSAASTHTPAQAGDAGADVAAALAQWLRRVLAPILQYLHDMDLLEEAYKDRLHHRLLSLVAAGADAARGELVEGVVLDVLRPHVPLRFAHRVRSMLVDALDGSGVSGPAVQEDGGQSQGRGSGGGASLFTCRVLNATTWPSRLLAPGTIAAAGCAVVAVPLQQPHQLPLRLPSESHELQQHLDAFSRGFATRNPKKRLMWLLHCGRATVLLHFPARGPPCEVRCSLLQASLLQVIGHLAQRRRAEAVKCAGAGEEEGGGHSSGGGALPAASAELSPFCFEEVSAAFVGGRLTARAPESGEEGEGAAPALAALREHFDGLRAFGVRGRPATHLIVPVPPSGSSSSGGGSPPSSSSSSFAQYALNVGFAPATARRRATIPAPHPPYAPLLARQRVGAARSLAVDAAIVRVMKNRRRVAASQLSELVMAATLQHFRCSARQVKERVLDLLDRGLLRRAGGAPDGNGGGGGDCESHDAGHIEYVA